MAAAGVVVPVLVAGNAFVTIAGAVNVVVPVTVSSINAPTEAPPVLPGYMAKFSAPNHMATFETPKHTAVFSAPKHTAKF